MNRSLRLTFLLLFFFANNISFAQAPKTQSIKGQVIDDVSKSSIAGANVAVLGDASLAAVTDANGRFVLLHIPVGRRSLVVSCTGYQNLVIAELLVTTGSEVDLTIALTQKVSALEEVVVRGSSKRALNNKMVAVSGRSFNAEQAARFAGALGDPSRMVAGFAGVISSNDSRNDIVVRGNSPGGLLWQLEGVDIPNPNHYGSLNSTGGPVSMLNNNNLAQSDFLTGAFPAQYGNALSSVFDLRLKKGNADKPEFLAQIGFTGFELGAEGPISHKGASYIVNYRYSTLAVLSVTGLDFGTGKAIPKYQDLNFKLVFPTGKKSTFSVFGLGGPSRVQFLGADADPGNLYGAADKNLFTHYFTGIAGATLESHFSQNTYGKLSAGYAHTREQVEQDSISAATKIAYRSEEHLYATDRISLNYFLSHKFDRKNSLVLGTNNALLLDNLFDKRIYGGGASERINLNQKDNLFLLQAYAQLKHRFSDQLFVNLGVHFQTLTLNHAASYEPRAGIQYVTTQKNVLAFGYGTHTQMQTPLVYFYQTHVNGAVAYTNLNLGFTRSRHFIGSYDWSISRDLHLKTEAYYQFIDHAPVEQRATGFSVLNEGAGFGETQKDSLVNKGRGKNYGLELSLERYFTKGSYFLITASLFDSKYKGSDGVWRNTAFNAKYALNLLGGKDVIVGKGHNTISANIKISLVGGRYASAVDVYQSRIQNTTVYDETFAPYSIRLPAYFRTDLKLGYRKNTKRSTLEFGIDLENLTMHKNVLLQTYSVEAGRIVSQYQQGFLPVPYFKFTF